MLRNARSRRLTIGRGGSAAVVGTRSARSSHGAAVTATDAVIGTINGTSGNITVSTKPVFVSATKIPTTARPTAGSGEGHRAPVVGPCIVGILRRDCDAPAVPDVEAQRSRNVEVSRVEVPVTSSVIGRAFASLQLSHP